MARVVSFELWSVDLPFRKPFKHAAAERRHSSSLFVKLITDTGAVGYGESLPRPYVTGETVDTALELLQTSLLPRLGKADFVSLADVIAFLEECDGEAPAAWGIDTLHTAAWCAVDLALLDAFGRQFEQPVRLGGEDDASNTCRHSVVVSSEASLKTLWMIRLGGIRSVKLKLEASGNADAVTRCRKILGRGCDLRADANMAWDLETATREMSTLSKYGIRSFEQPLPVEQWQEAAELVRRFPECDVMADESLNNAASLRRLVETKSCTAVNVRISKCGGLVASRKRCLEAIEQGLTLQLGCQVGESSLLSATQLVLLESVSPVQYLEGAFGKFLLREDPATPLLQFGFRGKSPRRPAGPGFGIQIDEDCLSRHATRHVKVSA